jgi:hypothetical protein
MPLFLTSLLACCLLFFPGGSPAPEKAASPGFLEGHLQIYSPKPVELADGNAPTPKTSTNYAEYPLIILSSDGKKEIQRVIADEQGNYRLALPPGTYVLDVQDRVRKHVRAKPRRFTVVSNQTVRVDMEMDTGIR